MANEKLAPAVFAFPETAAPGTPPAGHTYLYFKADGNAYQKNDAGTESALGGGVSGTVGGTDNALLRADVGAGAVQGSSVTMGDTGVVSGGMQIATNATTNNKIYLGGEVGKTLDATGDVTPGNDRNITITSNSGFSDDLVGIIGSFNSGEAIYLRAASGHTITVLHDSGATAGNDIHLPNDIPLIVLDEINYLRLDFAGGGHWCLNLSSGGSGTIDLTTDVTGVLPIANGGTNGSTATAGFDNLSPTTTKGDLIAHNGTDNVRVAVGTDGYRLTGRASDGEGLAWEADDVIAILRDEKSTGTDGGSSTATTWIQRDINTELYDPYSIVTISSNQITPIAGDYEIEVSTPGFQLLSHRIRLYNVTGGASVEEGQNARNATAGGVATIASLNCKFTANGTDAYRIDHYAGRTQATNGFGVAVSDGSAEVYTVIRLKRLSR